MAWPKNKKPARRRTSMNHGDLVSAVAGLSGIARYKVVEVLQALPKAILRHLRTGGAVTVSMLGRFSPVEKKAGRRKRLRIKFESSRRMHESLQTRYQRHEGKMEKYGVVLDREKITKARVTGKCPSCGKELPRDDHGDSVPHCEACGSQPFESKEHP